MIVQKRWFQPVSNNGGHKKRQRGPARVDSSTDKKMNHTTVVNLDLFSLKAWFFYGFLVPMDRSEIMHHQHFGIMSFKEQPFPSIDIKQIQGNNLRSSEEKNGEQVPKTTPHNATVSPGNKVLTRPY